MAGYSGTPLPKKLGIREGHAVALLRAPAGFDRTLGALPHGVTTVAALRGSRPFDVIVYFATRRARLVDDLPRLVSRLTTTGGLWIAWPKKASGKATDLSDSDVRELGLGTGLVDNKVCAVDETWSGLRFVIRRKDRKTR